MDRSTFKTVAKAKGLNQSDLARLAGVSRQAVSLWFTPRSAAGHIDLRSSHLTALASRLGLSIDLLTRTLPGLAPDERQRLETELLWDRSFADLDAFLVAVAAADERALARLVEKRGLFEAARIAGRAVWQKFWSFEKHLPPRQRTAMERLWNLQRSLGLI